MSVSRRVLPTAGQTRVVARDLHALDSNPQRARRWSRSRSCSVLASNASAESSPDIYQSTQQQEWKAYGRGRGRAEWQSACTPCSTDQGICRAEGEKMVDTGTTSSLAYSADMLKQLFVPDSHSLLLVMLEHAAGCGHQSAHIRCTPPLFYPKSSCSPLPSPSFSHACKTLFLSATPYVYSSFNSGMVMQACHGFRQGSALSSSTPLCGCGLILETTGMISPNVLWDNTCIPAASKTCEPLTQEPFSRWSGE